MPTHPDATKLLIAGLDNLSIDDTTPPLPNVTTAGDNGAAPEA